MTPKKTFTNVGFATLTAVILIVPIVIVITILQIFSRNEADANDLIALGAFDDSVVINEVLKKDIICLLSPVREPVLYLKNHFKDKKPDRPPSTESDTHWYLIAIDDNNDIAQVREINRSKIDLDIGGLDPRELALCSRKLRIRREFSAGRLPILKIATPNSL